MASAGITLSEAPSLQPLDQPWQPLSLRNDFAASSGLQLAQPGVPPASALVTRAYNTLQLPEAATAAMQPEQQGEQGYALSQTPQQQHQLSSAGLAYSPQAVSVPSAPVLLQENSYQQQTQQHFLGSPWLGSAQAGNTKQQQQQPSRLRTQRAASVDPSLGMLPSPKPFSSPCFQGQHHGDALQQQQALLGVSCLPGITSFQSLGAGASDDGGGSSIQPPTAATCSSNGTAVAAALASAAAAAIGTEAAPADILDRALFDDMQSSPLLWAVVDAVGEGKARQLIQLAKGCTAARIGTGAYAYLQGASLGTLFPAGMQGGQGLSRAGGGDAGENAHRGGMGMGVGGLGMGVGAPDLSLVATVSRRGQLDRVFAGAARAADKADPDWLPPRDLKARAAAAAGSGRRKSESPIRGREGEEEKSFREGERSKLQR